MYILTQFLDVITAGIEALVIYKFLHGQRSLSPAGSVTF
jgi:hypothetical protein